MHPFARPSVIPTVCPSVSLSNAVKGFPTCMSLIILLLTPFLFENSESEDEAAQKEAKEMIDEVENRACLKQSSIKLVK